MNPMQRVHISNLGTCKSCNALVFAGDYEFIREAGERSCSECGVALGVGSFGYREKNGTLAKEFWVTEDLKWVSLKPTTGFALCNLDIYG